MLEVKLKNKTIVIAAFPGMGKTFTRIIVMDLLYRIRIVVNLVGLLMRKEIRLEIQNFRITI